MKFRDLLRPFIIGVISDNDVAHGIRSIKKSEFAGADGFQLELHNLQPSLATKRAPEYLAVQSPNKIDA
jgi:hypothetical protein